MRLSAPVFTAGTYVKVRSHIHLGRLTTSVSHSSTARLSTPASAEMTLSVMRSPALSSTPLPVTARKEIKPLKVSSLQLPSRSDIAHLSYSTCLRGTKRLLEVSRSRQRGVHIHRPTSRSFYTTVAVATPSTPELHDPKPPPVTFTADGKAVLKAMTLPQLQEWVTGLGEKPTRAAQLWSCLYNENKLVTSVDQMHEVSAVYRKKLELIADVNGRIHLTETRVASDGTRKLLFRVEGGKGSGGIVETVLIPANGRITVCVSSQVGCAMNCQFCYTGRMGLLGNLSTEQIVEQVVEARREAARSGMGSVSNVVFMGMGEPLQNLAAVMQAVDILVEPRGLAMSPNKVTVSTSGLVEQMVQFRQHSPACLAVSVNATTDEVRNWLMPVNRKNPLDKLMGALREMYPKDAVRGQKRHVFLEYIMLKDLNDSPDDAQRLLDLTAGMNCKVNLIRFNSHDGSEFQPSDHQTVLAFRDALIKGGHLATIRESRGDDASAACGQLGSAEQKPSAPGTDSSRDGETAIPSPRTVQKPPRLPPPAHLREAVEEMRRIRPVRV